MRATISGHKPAVCITQHSAGCDIQEMELIYSVHDVKFGEQGLYYTGLKGVYYTGLRYLHRMICLCSCLGVTAQARGVLGIGDFWNIIAAMPIQVLVKNNLTARNVT